MQAKKLTVLAMPTMRCNLKCEYCHFKIKGDDSGYTWTGYDKEHHVSEEMTAEDLIKALSPHAPYRVDFSGGEPTLWKDFVKFTELIIDDNIRNNCQSLWCITSNTMNLPDDINFTYCENWTTSWHKESPQWYENIRFLKENLKNRHSISKVMRFDHINEDLDHALELGKLGGRVNLLRELNPEVDWEGSKEWDALLHLRKLGFNVVEEDIPANYKFHNKFFCAAGSQYVCIMPSGDVYTCYSEAMTGQPFTHIKNMELKKDAFKCTRECLGCALDHRFQLIKYV